MVINEAVDKLMKLKNSDDDLYYRLWVNGYDYMRIITNSPTDNCQICSINSMCMLFEIRYLDSSNIIQSIKVEDVLKKIYQYLKRQVLIDVNRVHELQMEKLVKPEHVVFKQQYKSSNGSAMTMYLLKSVFIEKL